MIRETALDPGQTKVEPKWKGQNLNENKRCADFLCKKGTVGLQNKLQVVQFRAQRELEGK